MERVTIKEIARILDISPNTVSKALNDKPGVSDFLRDKIKNLAREFNYVPNMFGRGLQGRSTKTIGVIISDNSNPNYSNHIKGIETKAEEFDYNIILCNSKEDINLEEKQIQLLIQKYVDGVIISPVPSPKGYKRMGLESLKKFGIPYVLINRYLPGEEDNCVKTDNILGAYMATDYLIKKGHKDIIFLTAKSSISSSSERIKGYEEALRKRNLPFDEKNIYKCDSISLKQGYESMLEILRLRRDFTTVFTFNDIIAFGAIKAIIDCRLRIPTDIAVMGYDNIPYSEICLVPLTTIHQDSFQIGITALEILMDKINGHRVDKRKMIFKPQIIERMST